MLNPSLVFVCGGWHPPVSLLKSCVILLPTVTVSGLLIGGDIARSLKDSGVTGKDVLLPPDCLNVDGLFLDAQTADTIGVLSGCRIYISSHSLIDSALSVVFPA